MLIRLVCFALALAASVGQAQLVVTRAQDNTPSATSRQRLVNLNMRNAPVKQVLDAIAQQIGARTLYSSAVVNLSTRVSVSLKNASAEQAIAEAIKGTALEARLTPQGETIMVGRKAVQPQFQGIIRGTVIDAKTSRPISGASVSLGQGGPSVTTGEDGTFRLVTTSTGVNTLTVRLVGYAKQVRSVTVGADATVTADFKLEPSASLLNEVVVTGTAVATELKAVPNAITVVTAKQIEERGITRIDQLFRGEIPGIFALNLGAGSPLGQVSIYSRGATAINTMSGGLDQRTFNTNPIKTFIDGVEVADAQYLGQIDPASIERMEILTGPQASTIYGSNAINGVIQIFTKRGAATRPQLNLHFESGFAKNEFSNGLSSDHLAEGRLSGTEGKLSYNAGGSWNYVGPWTPALRSQRLAADGGGRMELGKVTLDFSARYGTTSAKQTGVEGQRDLELRASGIWIPDEFMGARSLRTQSLKGTTTGLTMGYRPFQWWSHEITVGSDESVSDVQKTGKTFQNPGDTILFLGSNTSVRKSERYVTALQTPITSLAALNLTIGADHWRTTGSSWAAFPQILTGSFSSADNVSVTRVPADKNLGAFVQGQLAIKDALFLTYGLRSDWNPAFGDDAVVRPGRYGASYVQDLGPLSVKLRGTYGRSTRPPTRGFELPQAAFVTSLITQFGPHIQQLGNPDLGPEHQSGGEGGIEMYLGSRGSLVITRFNQTVDNLIGTVTGIDSVVSIIVPISGLQRSRCGSTFRTPEGFCYRYQTMNVNMASIRNQGWEMQGSVNVGPFTTKGTYSWTKSRILGVTRDYRRLVRNLGDYAPGKPFNYVPEHTWSVGTAYNNSATTVSLIINGVGQIYTNAYTDETVLVGFGARLTEQKLRFDPPVGVRGIGMGYATADLTASHKFTSRFDGVLNMRNLTDYYRNDLAGNSPTPGRQTRLGFRVRVQ